MTGSALVRLRDANRKVPPRLVPITSLVTTRDAMQWVLQNGKTSETPYAPVLLNARADMPGMWEIADGHHRVKQAVLDGHTMLVACVDPIPDDEPYTPPFYDFSQHVAPSGHETSTDDPDAHHRRRGCDISRPGPP